jgi:AhpD family alkylhydroperoxidase
MSRIRPLEPGEADDPEVNDWLREAAEGWYGDSAFFGAMAHCPELLARFMETFEAFAEGSFDPELLELARLRVAVAHQCAYCATVRTKAVEQAVAPREEAVFGEEIDTGPLSGREALAVQFADRMSGDPQRITDAFFEELREAFTETEIVELALFLSLEVGLDRFTIALRLDTSEDSPYPTGLEYPYTREQSD